MSYAVRFAPEAVDQLDAIEEYIARASQSPEIAVRFVDDVVAYCEGLKVFPERGSRRDEILPGLRVVGYRKNVTVAFRVDSANELVSVLGVFYGGQDYEAVFEVATPAPGSGH